MDNLDKAFTDLVLQAEKLGRDMWVLSGDMPPQLNAMLGTIWLEIHKLKVKTTPPSVEEGER